MSDDRYPSVHDIDYGGDGYGNSETVIPEAASRLPAGETASAKCVHRDVGWVTRTTGKCFGCGEFVDRDADGKFLGTIDEQSAVPEPASTELLPCPCGGKASLFRSLPPGKSCFVECDTCDESTPVYPTEKPAIAAWNTRKPAASPVAPPECEEYVAERGRYKAALEYILVLNRLYLGDDFNDGAEGSNYGHVREIVRQMVDHAESALASPVAGVSERIAEIEARLKAITEWPWKMITVPFVDDAHGHTLTVPNSLTPELREADTRFIAAAPEDIAYLLRLVEETR